MAGFGFGNVGFVGSLRGGPSYGPPPSGTAFVTAPASVEEATGSVAAPSILYPLAPSYYSTAAASGGRIAYVYSGAGSVFYEQWFYGIEARLMGYKDSSGAPFRIDLDDLRVADGSNQGSFNGTELIGLASAAAAGWHKITVYTNGYFMEYDRNDFL